MTAREVKPSTETVVRVVRYQIDVRSLSAAQRELLDRHAGCARQAWNWATARWHDWQQNLRGSVVDQAVAEVSAGLLEHPTLEQIGDLILETRALTRGEGDRKTWQNNAYTAAREIHGERKIFEDPYALAGLYRLDAQDEESRLHWWLAEGAKRPKGEVSHGVSTFAYQGALADFGRAVQAYWARPRYLKRSGRRLGAPRFKSRRDGRDAFSLQNLTTSASSPWKVVDDSARGHRLVFPNLGSIRMIGNTRELRRYTARGGRAAGARFTRRGDRWWVSINVQMPADHPSVQVPARPNWRQRAGGAVGVDLGVKALATLSTGEQIAGRAAKLRAQQALVMRLQQKLDRQHRAGSPACFDDAGVHVRGRCRWGGNREGDPAMSRAARTTRRRLAAVSDLLARQREGALHELTAKLVREHSQIAIEDLNVAGMTGRVKPKPDPENPGAFLPNRRRAKAGLNRAVLDAGFGEFRRQLEYKTERAGTTLTVIDRYYPSSKTCSRCGTVKAKLGLGERTYICETCGLILDRDVNAAINIRDLGSARVAAPTVSQDIPGAGVTTRGPTTTVEGPVEKTPELARESTGRASDPPSQTPPILVGQSV